MHGAWQLLNNVKACGAKYLLVGSYIRSTAANVNVEAGGLLTAGQAWQFGHPASGGVRVHFHVQSLFETHELARSELDSAHLLNTEGLIISG